MQMERRRSERTRVLRRGRIVFRNGHSVIDCVLLDLSDGGALLRAPGVLAIPEQFQLRIENGPKHQVRVCSRGADTASVSFLDKA